MLKVGLTGSIAVGKSFVCEVFRELGCHVLDADITAREVVEPGTVGLAQIVENFGKDIDRLFSINYQTWTKEQLITEINRLKSENEQLKNDQTLTASERQERLQQNQQKLEQIANYVSVDSKPNNSNNNFPTSLVIGGGVLLTIGLIGLLIVRKKKKK